MIVVICGLLLKWIELLTLTLLTNVPDFQIYCVEKAETVSKLVPAQVVSKVLMPDYVGEQGGRVQFTV